MPLVRIDIVKGRSPEELTRLLQALHDAVVAAFEVPVQDRYQVLTEHEPSRLILEDTGLGFTRTDDRILVQVFTRGRPSEKKVMLYALIAIYLGERLGIAADDVMITCVENNDVDWSFAGGRAQFLTGELD